jgi:hypothetical protein
MTVQQELNDFDARLLLHYYRYYESSPQHGIDNMDRDINMPTSQIVMVVARHG